VRDSRAKSAFLHITSTSRLLSIIRGDNRAIVRAASAASKAADYILAFGGEPNVDVDETGETPVERRVA
jgi:antirestriction protein ArdC